MCNSESISQQISLFRSLVQNRRFDDGTLRILESVLIIRDVKSLLDVRSSVIDFMRHESLCVLREFKEKSVNQQLLILEFFVRAFALSGDVESCLALRYEGLVLRELKSVTDHWLQVSYREWFMFAEHALENKFYAIARKVGTNICVWHVFLVDVSMIACEKALACFQTNNMVKIKDTDAFSEDMEAIRKVKRLKDIAMVKAASQSGNLLHLLVFAWISWLNFLHGTTLLFGANSSLHKLFDEKSVQAQAVEYLERKIAKHDKVTMLVFKEKQHSASVRFRNGIKEHNARKLKELRRL
ncbi:uncharacterized protein LOC112517877 [Cynara cardunculus var. scolymus]|uniref:uncharacterized protein LOC112517877 n=1 Tax=Cynara cardunculus var. scolymus TaxID=59895 RepID=UPI000D62D173|nr:uncharacterized protein LOC112517877 [Cynara cardunculus var. scolymus]